MICAAPTPALTVLAHGSLVLTGRVVVNSQTKAFYEVLKSKPAPGCPLRERKPTGVSLKTQSPWPTWAEGVARMAQAPQPMSLSAMPRTRSTANTWTGWTNCSPQLPYAASRGPPGPATRS